MWGRCYRQRSTDRFHDKADLVAGAVSDRITTRPSPILMKPDLRSTLITGGAGFIGCELSARLVDRGERVTVLDVLHPQVHHQAGLPERLHPDVDLLPVDVTDAQSWSATLRMVKPDRIVHLAAETGTGQSLHEASRHSLVNVVGTTRMTDALGSAGIVPEQVVLASSRAVYGEGLWTTGTSTFSPPARKHVDLMNGLWNPESPGTEAAEPVANSALTTPALPTSVYGSTKLAQEHILGAWCSALGSPFSVLRLQNVYGPGQSLGNAYTGIVTLFARQAKSGEEIELYEDGNIVRDFVFIEDVVDALIASIDHPPPARRTIDIGSGRGTTVAELAGALARRLDAPEPRVTGKFRDGDIRAAFADTTEAESDLGWRPAWKLDDGLEALLTWMDKQPDKVTT